jgi:hypothetical protein
MYLFTESLYLIFPSLKFGILFRLYLHQFNQYFSEALIYFKDKWLMHFGITASFVWCISNCRINFTLSEF